MSHAYTEEQLVELPAFDLFASLGWQTVSALEEVFGPTGTLGRTMAGEVVLAPRLRAALSKLNPKLPPEAIEAAMDEVTRDRSAMDLAAANREVYLLLKDGVRVSVPDAERGGQKPERVRVVDWDHPATNDFLAVRQISFSGPLYTCRPDIVGFVNGLPLVVLEFKKPGVPARQAFDENLTSYKHPQNGVPALFVFNAMLIASNGTESRVGSITADWGRFFDWKRIEREDEPRRVSLEVMLRGTCDRARLLDLVENFTLFSEHKAGLVKILGQNHQFLGVNNAIAALFRIKQQQANAADDEIAEPSSPVCYLNEAMRAEPPTARMEHSRLGVFWHTQGSGKSFSMVFFAQKVLRKLAGNWTFVVVTDRVELDDQIAKSFAACGAVTDANECHASSGAHLRQLLGENHRYVFTLIHKFQTAEMLNSRRDVIVLTDEAHRSQYDTLALNMRAALPRAMFLAFTGTPLIAGEERTREVFGDYVSIYDFQQSVQDGATVPLFYENRTPELQLTNPALNEDIYNVIEDAGLDDAQEERLAQVLGQNYHILTRDDRLETVAKDIVRHFLGRGFQGKAMVVSLDKATALKMHDKVRKHWDAERERVQDELAKLSRYKITPKSEQTPDPAPPAQVFADERKAAELQARLKRLDSVDMALIVSPGQNEIEQMKKLGLDIVPHRRRMNDSQPPLDEKFKDPDDALSIVFLCAMWLTGFDVPSCSTLYLDKPMRNHTLMQTIARANRIYPGKHSGLIVDYANVFASLEKALAIYGAGKGGQTPVRDKKQLVADLKRAVGEATDFCVAHRVELPVIESLPVRDFQLLEEIEDAVNALIAPDPLRKEFIAHARIVSTLYNAVKPDTAAIEFAARVSCLVAIADAIRAKLNPEKPDISAVLLQIGEVLDNSIEGVTMSAKSAPVMDLSKIDFETLAKRFKESKRKNIELETLKAAIRAMLERLIRLNRTRVDFQKQFEELIEAYNSGSKNIDQLFRALLALSRGLTEEETRHVRENLTEEELTIFDILTRPAPALSEPERKEVKLVAKHLLDRLETILTFNWRSTTQGRARVQDTIKDTLDEGLPRAYDPAIFTEKCARLFEHIYETRAA